MSERLGCLGEPNTSSEARGLEILVNLLLRAKREGKRSWSTYHLEQSQRLRGLVEPATSSKARG